MSADSVSVSTEVVVTEVVTEVIQANVEEFVSPACEAAKKYTVSDLSDLLCELTAECKDIDISDVIRIVPRLSAYVQKLDIAGSEKFALVMAAAHSLVDRMPDDAQSSAHALVDKILPAAIQNVLDVAKGRVTWQQVVATQTVVLQNPEVVESAKNCCLPLLSQLFRK
jgi:hypothetical protein